MKLKQCLMTIMVVGMAFFVQTAKAQVGNEFWFVAPEVSDTHGDEPFGFRITAMESNVNVTISMPADPTFTPINFSVAAYKQVSIRSDDGAYLSWFNTSKVENKPSNSILKKGILITSTGGDISAYYEVMYSNNPDVFTLKGQNALGTEFYVPSQNVYPNRPMSIQAYEHVDIVATEDNTSITIVPTVDIAGGGLANTPINITLNRGQSYSITGNSIAASYSLAGTYIKSDKKIAITVSDDSIEQYSNSGSYDLVGDQIVPTSVIGTEYIAIKTSNDNQGINKVFLLGVEDNTSVTVDNNAAFVLNKGQIKEVDIATDAVYIKSSKAIYAYQVCGLWNTNGNEMGSALLPSISCTGSKRVSFTRHLNKRYFVQIMAQRKTLGQFAMYNASNVEQLTFSAYINDFNNWKKVVPSDKGVAADVWYTIMIPMSSAPFSISTGTYSIANTTGLFHLSALDENGGSMSYGYFSSYSSVKIEGPSQACYDDEVILTSKYTGGTLSWFSSITGTTVLSTNSTLEVTKSAIYWVELDNQLGCVATDYLDVKINKPVFTLTAPGTVCPNEPVTLPITSPLPTQYTYVWEYLGNKTTGPSITITPTKGQTIDLSLTATDAVGCATKDTVVVISFADDQVDLVDVQAQVCVGDTIKNLTQMANYEWKINGAVVTGYNKPYILATVSGTYELTGYTVHNCKSSDSKTITVNPLPVFEIVGQTVCANTQVDYGGPTGMSTYLWNDGTTGSTYKANAPGVVSLQVKNSNGCVAKDTATVIWRSPLSVQLSYQTSAIASTVAPDNISTCPENTLTLTAPSGFANYKWTVGGVITQGPAITSMNVPLTSGIQKDVLLEVTDAYGCTASDNTKVIAYTSPTLTVDKAAYCVDETMTAGIMNSYEWSFNSGVIANSNVKTYKATQAGTYTVRSWDSNGCVSQSINITANALPLPSIASPTVCASEPNVLTGNPATGVTYNWSQDVTAITGNLQKFSVPAGKAYKVTLEVTDVNGCKADTLAIPSWFPLPSVDISYFNDFLKDTITANNFNLCPNKQVELKGKAKTSAGIVTYKWYINGNFVAGNNTNSLDVTTPPSGQTTIKLEVFDNNNCTASDEVVLKVFADPANILTMPNDICLGSALSVDSIRSSLDHHEWTFLANNDKNKQYTYIPDKGGVYKLDVWDKNGCWATENYTVVDPTITLTDNPTTVAECANSPHVFSVAGANTAGFEYTWTNKSTGTTTKGTSLNATVPGDYWVVADHNKIDGCNDREDATLTWHPDKLLDLEDKLSVCNSAGLSTLVVGKTDVEFQNWKWVFNGSVVSTTNSYDIPTATGAGTYTVTADYIKGGDVCPLSKTFDFEVLPTELNPIILDQSAQCDPSKPDIICLCEGEEIVITANNGFTKYQWYSVEGVVRTPVGGDTPKLKVSTSGDYLLEAQQQNGCPSTGKITVNVTENPEIKIDDRVECEGVSFDIVNTATDKDKYTYEWYYNGYEPIVGNTSSIRANKKGTYKAVATYTDLLSYNKQCKAEDEANVVSPVKPPVVLTDEAICGGTSYDLSKKFDQSSVPGLTTHDWYQVIDPSNSIKLSNLNVNTPATYDLRISVDALGISCNYNYPMNLNVVALPVVPNGAKYEICKGDTALLDAKGDYLSYNWTYHGSIYDPSTIVSSNFPNEKVIKATEGGYYVVIAKTQVGELICSNSPDPMSLTVNALPQLTVGTDKTYLCKNGKVQLTVSNASGLTTNYVWTNGGETNSSIEVGQAGYYGVKGTDIKGCTATTGHNVIDYTPTDIVLPTFPAICYGDSVVLPAIPGVTSFQWFYGSVNNTEQGLINQPWKVGKDGVYVVSYTTEAAPDGCPIEKSLTLTVMPLPTFNVVAPSQLLCDGDSFTLDAGADYPLYKWVLKGTNGVADKVVGIDRTYTGTVSGNYMLQAWTSGGCTDSTFVNVVVNANPAVSVGADFDACVGVDFTLTLANASNLTGIVWSTGAKDIPSITTKLPGLYTVTAYDGTGCYSVDSIKVGNFPVTVIEFPQVSPICSNDTYTLTSPLAMPAQIQSYQWYYNTVGGLPQGLPNLPWTVNTPGNYVLEVKDLNGCFSSSVFKLATIPAPDFTLGPDRSGCVHDTLRIVAKQSYIRYEWNGNPADNKYYKEVDPAITAYSLEVEDRNGCVATSNVNFVTNPLPVVNLGNDVTMCAGPLTKLDPGGPYPSVLWSTGAISPTLLAEAGTYQVWVTDANNCVGTDDITITWLPNPRPDLGPDELICPVEDLLVDAGSGYSKYLWHTGAVSQTIIADIVDTVNLVSVTDFNGCEGWDSKLVFKMGDPDYILSSDTVVCAEETVVLDAGSEYSEFLWSNGQTTQTIDVTTPGDYWVRASDGCFVVRDTANVSFWELPVVAKLDTMVYAQIVVLAEGGLRPYNYALNEGSFQSDSIFSNLKNGTYIAYVQDGNGCATSDTVTISSVYDIDIPKFFTPNGDGFNDEWEIGGLERFPDAEIIIYDRYGKQLAKFGSDPAKWDGRYLNKPMPSDDYWFVINLIHINKTIKGNLTLKR